MTPTITARQNFVKVYSSPNNPVHLHVFPPLSFDSDENVYNILLYANMDVVSDSVPTVIHTIGLDGQVKPCTKPLEDDKKY